MLKKIIARTMATMAIVATITTGVSPITVNATHLEPADDGWGDGYVRLDSEERDAYNNCVYHQLKLEQKRYGKYKASYCTVSYNADHEFGGPSDDNVPSRGIQKFEDIQTGVAIRFISDEDGEWKEALVANRSGNKIRCSIVSMSSLVCDPVAKWNYKLSDSEVESVKYGFTINMQCK